MEPRTRTVVTGGSGFIGEHLIDALVEAGHVVTVIDLVPSLSTEPKAGVCYNCIDLRNPRLLPKALDGCELVFHLAGNASGTVSVKNPRLDFESNAVGTFNLCEAVARVASPRLVYLSSAMVYGSPEVVPVDETQPARPFYPYGTSKYVAELVIATFRRSFNLDAVIARAFPVYGPGEHAGRAGAEPSQFLRWHLNGLPIRATGDVDRKSRDFIHVSDLVRGLLLLAERGSAGEVYNLGTGHETSLRELALVIGDITKSPAILAANRSIMDDSYRLVADIRKIRSLGYEAKVSLVDGLTDVMSHLGERPELPGFRPIFRGDQAD